MLGKSFMTGGSGMLQVCDGGEVLYIDVRGETH